MRKKEREGLLPTSDLLHRETSSENIPLVWGVHHYDVVVRDSVKHRGINVADCVTSLAQLVVPSACSSNLGMTSFDLNVGI